MTLDTEALKRWLPWVLIALVVLASANGANRQPGPRIVLLVREASEVSPQLANTETLLRDGPAADYLASKRHNLLILSDDMPLPSSAPASVKAGFEKAKKSMPAVVVCILAADDKGILGIEKISETASPDDILAIVRKYGG